MCLIWEEKEFAFRLPHGSCRLVFCLLHLFILLFCVVFRSDLMGGLSFDCWWLLVFVRGIKTAIVQWLLFRSPKQIFILCIDFSKACINLSLCPTCSAAAFRIYKKTSAAVCERPRGPELWTISSIVSTPRSPTVWHWNNRCPNVGFLMQRGDISVRPQPSHI